MKIEMKNLMTNLGIVVLFCMMLIHSKTSHSFEGSSSEQAEAEPEKGPHRGRLLKDDDFVIELSIFETGVPPEFRVWITDNGQPVKPAEVSLTVTLTRLGGIEDAIGFKPQTGKFAPQSDFLRGDSVIYEPHSFVVTINAEYQGKSHRWQYDNFEGRVVIEGAVAEALEISTSVAGPAVLKETIAVYGKLATHPEYMRDITARFEGTIEKVNVGLGQQVKKGQPLVTIESNESLKPYTLLAPIDGVVTQRNANSGEQTNARILLSITNHSVLMSELAVFPTDRQKIKLGAAVQLLVKGHKVPVLAVVKQIDSLVQANQSIIVRAELSNENKQLVAGSFVKGEIEVAEHQVALAVKRSGLQAFRDFTVVFVKIGDEYEVRMLDLGRVAGKWVEVLGGLEPGSEYVSKNSYIIKADIEKSGASHDH
jgi:cobalt-zinc-cadmium efflux system membrane fusion protein